MKNPNPYVSISFVLLAVVIAGSTYAYWNMEQRKLDAALEVQTRREKELAGVKAENDRVARANELLASQTRDRERLAAKQLELETMKERTAQAEREKVTEEARLLEAKNEEARVKTEAEKVELDKLKLIQSMKAMADDYHEGQRKILKTIAKMPEPKKSETEARLRADLMRSLSGKYSLPAPVLDEIVRELDFYDKNGFLRK